MSCPAGSLTAVSIRDVLGGVIVASWAPERRKMTVPPDEISEARRKEAVQLLAWSAHLDREKVKYEKFCEERSWKK